MKITDVDKVRHMQVQFEVAEQVKSDSRFTPVKVWIAHTGKNLNKSNFSKELLESMIPSLKFIPIVGFIQASENNKDDFAGHEERYIVTSNGVETEYLGRMYGFIPEDNNARFEMKTVNGVEREYLVADGIIVNKFAKAKEILERDSEKGQSMELLRESLDGYYEKVDDQFVITSADFEALCILGDSKIPAMTGGAIEKIQFTAIKFELQELINELKLEMKNEKGGNGLDITKFEELLVNYTHVSNEFAEDIKGKLETFETEESLVAVLKEENDAQFALAQAEANVVIEPEIPAETLEEVKANYELTVTELTSKLDTQKTEYETKVSELEGELTQLREYKQSIETKVKVDYVSAVENLTESEKAEMVAEVDNYSLEQLSDEVAKIIGKKAIKFSTETVKVIEDTFTKTKEEDKSVKSYDHLFQK